MVICAFFVSVRTDIMGAILRANLAAWLYLAQAKYLALGLNKA